MKSYDELTNDLLQRRDRYVADQKKKRKNVMRAAISLGCFCLAALLSFGIRQGGMLGTAPPDKTLNDALYPGIKYNFNESRGESADNPAANTKIIIHSIDSISSARMNIALMQDDFVEMTRDEMAAYYGVDYIPGVPADIKPWKDERSGIYKRNGGTGEVYWDADILNYSNEDYTREVSLEVSKGHIPWLDYMLLDPDKEKSIINNVELMIGKTDSGYYYTEFMYKNVGFTICANGVTQNEFVSIIASIIK